MLTVWKTQLKAEMVQEIKVPAGAQILCAHEQHEQVCVWYRCDTDQPLESRKVAVVMTDHPAPPDGQYIGSAFPMGGSLVLHVFIWPRA